ncbi:MAG: exosortase system-associated protein, TIGR04073 family [Candidatus Omnitrophota bacterium]
MKMLKLGLIILMVLCITNLSYGETTSNITPANKGAATGDTSSVRPAGAKAERGIKNILFGWTEIPKSIVQVTKDSKNPFWGITGGTLKGLGKAFPRTVSGVADLVSFPIASYDKMPIKPDELNTGIK